MSVAKRPRLSGSFSPASPPYHLAKGVEQGRLAGFQHPNTPTSPPPHSMSSLANSISTGSTINTQLTDITPASTAASPPQPTTEVKREEGNEVERDADDDVHMTDEPSGDQADEENTVKTPTEDHMRTDHDRIRAALEIGEDEVRLRDYLLDVNVGPFYKLRDKPSAFSSPRPSENLIKAYNLDAIAKTVERFDPLTGAKINKLRKSYENQVKQLAIAGRNKSKDAPGELTNLMAQPEDDYRNTQVNGKAMELAREDAFRARLTKALAIPVPHQKLSGAENERWKALIGTEEPVKLVRPAPQVTVQQAPPSNGTPKIIQSGARPERSGKKRRYHDASFTGYGEGYLDDDHDDSEDGMALAARQRKRAKA